MDSVEQKRAAATAAIAWVEPRLARDLVLGVGTGSTADHFIDLLVPFAARFAGAVASSARSATRLATAGIRVFELDALGELPIYVDGADEINDRLEMIKGGGGALTREKIVAAASTTFVCIVDASKRVRTLGRFPLPVEVIPMAGSHVVRKLVEVAAAASLATPTIVQRRAGDGEPYVTDNGNRIVDVAGWSITDPRAVEASLGRIVGVVESGLFAWRPADVLMVAGERGVETIERA